jgi:hypothetical protein
VSFITDYSYNFVDTMIRDETIDDSVNETPMAGLKGSMPLKDRFTMRLGRMLEANVEVPEKDNTGELVIYIADGSVKSARKEQLQGFASNLQYALRAVAGARNGK